MTQEPIYRDTSHSIEARVDDLLGRMTVEEKLAQLGAFWAFEILDDGAYSPDKADRLLEHGIGQVTRIAGATDLTPRAGAELANTIQRHLRDRTRLGIPAIVHEECLHGVMGRDRMGYPQSIGLAATWDPELVGEMAARIGRSLRAGGAHQALAPILDVTRDPRWGRTEETFGEDPCLVAALGVAYVRGIQGGGRGPDAVLATGKHMVGHGLPEGGLNHAPAHIGPRELRDVFLTPFEAAVRTGGLRSMMHAYDDVDGIPCVASRELLTTILRDEWGFDGIVVSDYSGIELLVGSHQVTGEMAEAAVLALQAGVDSDLPTTAAYGAPLRQAIERGRVDIGTVDEAVRRMLRVKLELGLFEQPFVDPDAPELAAAAMDTDRRLSGELARRSIVLLTNDGTLPLAGVATTSRGIIAVIGPSADSTRNLLGDYDHVVHVESLVEMRQQGHFSLVGVPQELDASGMLDGRQTVLGAIAERAPRGTQVRYARGCGLLDGTDAELAAAVKAATGADVAILVLGERSGLTDDCLSGEARDRLDIGLPGRQGELLAAVAATGTPVILVLVAGRPLAIPEAVTRCAAVLHAWVPNVEGPGAIASVLFGDTNPGGKLPITVPYHVGQVPIYYAHKPSGGHSNWKGDYVDGPHRPLFPFGHGRSYTTFLVDDLVVEHEQVALDGEIVLSVAIANTGERSGDEVVQVYLRDVEASVTRPVRQLCGFRRLTLAPGERRRVTFRIGADQLAFSGVDLGLILEPGRVDLFVGTSSVDDACTASVQLTGEARRLAGRTRFAALTSVE